MKTTQSRIRRIIKEEVAKVLSEGISEVPTGRVEVEWDFSGVEGFTDDGLSYEEAEAKADLPPVVDIDPAVMAEYAVDATEYGAAQADQLITDWLSDEFGWLHQGWSWVDDQATPGVGKSASIDAFLNAVPNAEKV